ncbi:hypothetical protein MUY27_12330 [Mucilaginibacter sp. RS28]|uniref:Uncharacterized protein n=1 Tax=Mucilaginibacter straminoryzae TaxID=2932774 RepID=A0A9X2B9I9_9SPHI|nr:hypothetical protein [Mucilaginibacter straminoryzae]MCJ8210496.1 hypothetical protein [Mucilaginibacter straminoryzae]
MMFKRLINTVQRLGKGEAVEIGRIQEPDLEMSFIITWRHIAAIAIFLLVIRILGQIWLH